MHEQHAAFAHPDRNVSAFVLHPGMRVADFGAGSGAYVLAMAEALSGSGTVYAIDIQRDLLRRIKNEAARRGFQNVDIIWADLEQPGASKLSDNLLDVVLVSNLLFQVPEKKALFIEAHRILKPTGKLIVIDWSESFGGLGPTTKDVVTKDSALRLAEESGFVLTKEFNAGAHHYGLMLHLRGEGEARAIRVRAHAEVSV